MAISTPTNKTTAFDDANASVYTVASQTYTAGRLYLLAFSASRTGATPDDPVLTGQGTWNLVTAVSWGSTNTKRLTLYRYLATSTTTGTVIATYANALNAALWSLTEIASGFDTTGTNGAGALAQGQSLAVGTSSTSNTVALTAFGTGGIGFGVFSTDISGDIVPANSYIELGQASSTAPVGTIQSEYRLTDADPSVTFAAARCGGIGVEIKQAGGTAYTMPADGAAFTETGQAASLERGVKVPAATTSFAFSGVAASLEVGRKVTAISGAMAVTGTAANLAAGRRLLAAIGSVALTGTDATLVYAPSVGYPMPADSADFTLNGTDAAFAYARLMAALQAVYALAGTDSRLDWSGYVPPPTPAERSYTVAFEDRTFVIQAQDRTYTVAAERRVLELA
jgi:hypothetical protein